MQDADEIAARSKVDASPRSRDLLAFAPLLCAVAAAAFVALGGVTQRELLASPLADYAYGFFFDRFAPFAFIVVYALARILLVAVTARDVSLFARLATTPLALAAILAVSLYPTFGGFVLRGAFFSGGTTFLDGVALPGAYVVGAGFATGIFALALGLGVALVRLRVALRWRAALFAVLRYLALVFAGIVLLAPPALGLGLFGAWPRWPLDAVEGATLVALVLVALLPHALIVRVRG